MPALGEEFRIAREARGLTLSDVAEQIHIRSVYLNAIESEDWPAIGAPVYVRGFIRTYARFLGVSPENAVERFNQTVPAEGSAGIGAGGATGEREGGPSVWAVAGALLAFLLVAFVAYEWWLYAHPTTPPPAVSAVSPAPTPASPAASAAPRVSPAPTPVPGPGAHRLAVRLTERSWLRVTIDGKVQVEGIFPAGTTRTFGGSVADVRVGNAGGVSIAVGDGPALPLGKTGDVVERRYTL